MRVVIRFNEAEKASLGPCVAYAAGAKVWRNGGGDADELRAAIRDLDEAIALSRAHVYEVSGGDKEAAASLARLEQAKQTLMDALDLSESLAPVPF